MDNQDGNEERKGFTVSQLEGTAIKYAAEIGLIVVFIITAIFTLIWSGAMMVWSILLSMILGCIGAVFPDYVEKALKKSVDFVYKDNIMLIVAGVLLLIIAIFIPVLIFALMGVVTGGSISGQMRGKRKPVAAKKETPAEDHNMNDHSDHSDHDNGSSTS